MADHNALGTGSIQENRILECKIPMGKVSDRNPMIPEANTKSSVPHFPWFNLGDFLSATPPKTNFSPFQTTPVNLQPGLPVHPIRYISPISETAKKNDNETTPTKVKKPKQSKKSSTQDESKVLGPKKPKSPGSKKKKGETMVDAKREKNPNVSIDITSIDFSGLPSPVCSCTGVARVCYKWGNGGWQSACCNTSISKYPLPMSSTRPGSRVAGRKMSNGAYRKLLMRLAAAGHNLTHPADLKDHWARHGTNRYVTIK